MMKKFGIGMVVAAVLTAALCASAMAGEIQVRPVTVARSGEWTCAGGGVWLLKAVHSGSTGGVLKVVHDLMIGGAGSVTRTLAQYQTVTVSRAVQNLPTDVYILPGQKIVLTNTTTVASHPVFLILEKQQTE
jgi:hypothetical protein